MPTAAEYSSWARSLDDAARGTLGAVTTVRAAWEAGPLIGGQQRSLALVVEEVQHLVADVAVQMAGLAEECRRRAAVCAAWTVALAAAEGGGSDEPRTVAPARPASWAEAGL